MKEYKGDFLEKLLIGKNKVALLITPFQLQIIKYALLKQKAPSGYGKLRDEVMKELGIKTRVGGQTISLAKLIKGVPYESD